MFLACMGTKIVFIIALAYWIAWDRKRNLLKFLIDTDKYTYMQKAV